MKSFMGSTQTKDTHMQTVYTMQATFSHPIQPVYEDNMYAASVGHSV